MFVDKQFYHITFNVTQICVDNTCVSPTKGKSSQNRATHILNVNLSECLLHPKYCTPLSDLKTNC
jgi:hypothetical protein